MSSQWEVEYTDELGAWWNDLHESEQESIDASVRLLEEKGPHTLDTLTPLESTVQDTPICANSVYNTKVVHTEFFTHLTLDVVPSC